MPHYADGEAPTEADIEAALVEAVAAIEAKGLDYLLMGGAGSVTYGRHRATDDIDLFVRPEDAGRVLDTLGTAGFETNETELDWLHKAFRYGVLVDVIYRSAGDVLLDDAMLQRATRESYRGTDALMMCPEDLVIIKALASREPAIRHWFDALALIARCELDWPYIVGRARRHGPRRVLSLLLYAEAEDLPVPAEAIESLWAAVHAKGAAV